MSPCPVEPHLFTGKIREMTAFYVDALGFRLAARFPEEGEYTWCSLALGDARIMFSNPVESGAEALRRELDPRYGRPGAVILYVETDDVDALHERAKEKGVRILEPLWNAWWGLRQFTVADPEGNLLAFFRPLERD